MDSEEKVRPSSARSRSFQEGFDSNSHTNSATLGPSPYAKSKVLDDLFRKLGSYGSRNIAKVLANNSSVLRVRLDNFELKDEGTTHISQSLKTNSFLTDLSLCGNEIGDIGANSLADALLLNRKLRILRLMLNPIGDVGCSAFGRALMVNRTLRILRLDDCQIGADGCIALAEALEENRSLEFLHLSNNIDIGNAGYVNLSIYLNSYFHLPSNRVLFVYLSL